MDKLGVLGVVGWVGGVEQTNNDYLSYIFEFSCDNLSSELINKNHQKNYPFKESINNNQPMVTSFADMKKTVKMW